MNEEKDKESRGAKWVSLSELKEMNNIKALRYDDPLKWARFIEEHHGQISPMSLLGTKVPEGSPPTDLTHHKPFRIIDGMIIEY